MSTTIRLDLVDNVTRRLDRIENRLTSINGPVNSLQRSFGGLKGAVGGFVGALAVREIGQFVGQITEATNRFQNYENSLRLITNSQGELESTFRKLQQAARDTRSGLDGTVDLYTKLVLTTKDLGVSNEQVLNVTQKFQQALALSGADANTAAGAIRQFGQAMASGTVRGDEFNSIVEALGPALAIMAEESGLTVGELRKLSREGKLTAQVFFDMIEGSNALADSFNKTRPTIDQMKVALSDAFDEFLVELGEATMLTQAYTATLEGLTQGFMNASRTMRGLSVDMQDIFDAQEAGDYAQAIQLIDDKLFVMRKNANIPFLADEEGIRNLTEMRIEMTILAKEAEKLQKATKPIPKTLSELEQAMAQLKPYEGVIESALGADSVYELASPIEQLNMDIAELETALANLLAVQNALAAEGKMTGATQLEFAKKIQGINETIIIKEAEIAEIRKKANDELMDMIDDVIKKNAEAAEKEKKARERATEAAEKASERERERLARIQEAIQNKAEAVRVGLLTEEEAEIESYNNRLKALEDFYAQEGMLTQQGQKYVERLEKAHGQRMAQIAKQNYDEQLSRFQQGKFAEIDFAKFSEEEKTKFIIDGGRMALDALGKHSKEAFQLAKAAAMAEAIINTAQGVTKALAQGGIFGPLLAGIIVAAGAAQIATIASQQYTGRQFGGPVTRGRPYMVGEAGPEAFIPAGSGQIVPNRGLSGGDTVNINFEINAVDAAGVDQIILQRKALITNIVREGMENQGRRSVV